MDKKESTSHPHTPLAKRMPTDGGYGWVVVFGSFIVLFAMYGVQYSYGVFQQRYKEMYPNASTPAISFIGSVAFASMGLFGFLTGRVGDRLGYRITVLIGMSLKVAGLVLASFANQIWQLYLTQGLMFGLGTSLAFYPCVLAPTLWFERRRGLATGLAMAGSGVGGMALAPITSMLIEQLGVAWTLRCLAAGLLVLQSFAVLIYRQPPLRVIEESVDNAVLDLDAPEHPPNAASVDLSADSAPSPPAVGSRAWMLALVKKRAFLGLWATNIFGSLGYLVPFYYILPHAVSAGIERSDGALLVSVMNGASAAGRIILGFASDYCGRVNTYIGSMMLAGIACFAIWLPFDSMPPLGIFSFLYGLFMGGFSALTPVVISSAFGVEGIATTAGMIYASTGVSNLIGAPIAGAILDATLTTQGYNLLIIYAGVMIVTGACLSYLLVRCSLTRRFFAIV